MGARTTSRTGSRRSGVRTGRGRRTLLAAVAAALFSLPAGAVVASSADAPASPGHHLGGAAVVNLADDGLEDVCAQPGSVPPAADAPADVPCRNVNGWQ